MNGLNNLGIAKAPKKTRVVVAIHVIRSRRGLVTIGYGHTEMTHTVTVTLPPKEGVTYGFCLVVKSKAGLGKPAPKSGDTPQVRVEVDTRPPTASLYAPQPDPARHDGLVLIWKAEDRNLAANPITLEWAAQRDGRWELIGEPHLPNTGRYTWQVPDSIPPKVYLRLTVRDTAGNSAVAQTPEPILIDLTVPEITNVGLSAR